MVVIVVVVIVVVVVVGFVVRVATERMCGPVERLRVIKWSH